MISRDRRALLLGVAVILSAAAIKGVRVGLAATVHSGIARANIETLVAAATTRLSSLPRLEDSVAAAQQALIGLAPSLLAAHSRADAHAELGGWLNSLAARTGGRVTALIPEDDSVGSGRLRRISLRAAFEAGPKAVATMLRTFGASQPLVAIERLSINADDPFPSSNAAPALRIEVVCSGWFLEDK